MVLRIIIVFSVLITPIAMSSSGCGDLEISRLFSRLELNEQDQVSVKTLIEKALTEAKKTSAEIEQIVTKSEFDREERFGFSSVDRAMDMGEQLDVLTSRESTKILIRFSDRSF